MYFRRNKETDEIATENSLSLRKQIQLRAKRVGQFRIKNIDSQDNDILAAYFGLEDTSLQTQQKGTAHSTRPLLEVLTPSAKDDFNNSEI